MRLIDADALKDMDIEPCDSRDWLPIKERIHGMNYIRRIVKNAPTVDAVEVVRCRDCCYKDKANVNNKGFLICPASGMEITDDDYCSYGERKGGDE